MSVRQDGDKIFIEGIVLPPNGESNHNGRKYDREAVIAAVNKFNENIDHQFGEIFDTDINMHNNYIDMNEVSHKTELLTYNDDGSVTGRARLLNTPQGKIVRKLIESPVKLGVSLRGMEFELTPIMQGNVSDDKVVTELDFIRVDVTPSKSEPED